MPPQRNLVHGLAIKRRFPYAVSNLVATIRCLWTILAGSSTLEVKVM
jgi:hypothetical protein